MVFFYTLGEKATKRGFKVDRGRDKYENEDLLEYGWPEDVWFHVDNFSSAHVYLRCPPGVDASNIPPAVVKQCCQIVKNNSIEGSKRASVFVVYTQYPNLHKDKQRMEIGAVGYHDRKLVHRVSVEKDKEMVKRLEKTKEERVVDLPKERRRRDEEERRRKKNAYKEAARQKRELEEKRKKEAYDNSYDRLFDGDAVEAAAASGGAQAVAGAFFGDDDDDDDEDEEELGAEFDGFL